MALINDPELIILDEPTSGLDAVARREIQSYIVDLRASQKTTLLSTHYIEEAEQLCDRVIILRAGEVVADGSPSELTSQAGIAEANLSFVLVGEFDPDPLLQTGATPLKVEGDRHPFIATQPTEALRALGEVLRNSRAVVEDIQMKRPSLEDVYVALMGADGASH
jgi:ABC-2 type transport system ATP-binding protein